ncbi:putative ribonuclease H-like domain-containing protein [Tanacetum coccineum]
MAYTSNSSGSDTEANLEIVAYQLGLESVEAQLVVHQKNEVVYEEKIAVLEFEVKDKSNAITRLKNQLDETLREKDELKAKLEQFETSSKNLTKLINSQISSKDKTGLGYGDQLNENDSSGSELFNSVFDSHSSDGDDNQTNDRFKKDSGYHAVPPPLTGNYMPPLADLSFVGLDDSVYRPTTNKTSASVSQVKTSITPHSNTSVEMPRVESVRPMRMNLLNLNKLKKPRVTTQNPKVDRRDWNGKMTQKLGLGFGSTKKACFVCGSYNHLIKDYDFHEKRMAKKSVLQNMGKNTGQREMRPVWNNVQRINHQNKFVPSAVLTRSGKVQVSTAKKSSLRATSSTSTFRPVNTATHTNRVNVSKLRTNAFHKSHSPIRRSFYKPTAPNTRISNKKVNTVRVNGVNTAGQTTVSAVKGNRVTAVKASAGCVWRPKMTDLNNVNPQQALKNKGIFDSGCSRHMTGNKDFLIDYQGIDYDKMDVKSVFLYGTVKNEVYVRQPPGFVDPEFPEKVYKVEKALYGDTKLLEPSFSDSDYTGASLDRKSTTRGCQFLGSRLISWQCKKQTVVANSTTKAEYIAASHCCGQVLWIQNQMLDYGYNFMQTKIHVDNESAICVVKNPVYHSKTKHIEIRHHFIRDSYEKKLIEMVKIHTDYNVADLLTKAFDVTRFQFLIASIGLELQGYLINDGYADLVIMLVTLLKLLLFHMIGLHHITNGHQFTMSNRQERIGYSRANDNYPTIYASYIEQFWNTATSKITNSVKQIHAIVDGKAVVILESSVRSDLLFNDEDGVTCLTNDEIFENLALMGYEQLSTKLTFQKGSFSPQWKFLIHTILHCISSKSTAWNEFSTNLASAVICLAKGQKFNFSKLIFDGMLRNLDSKKFLMYPRFLQLFLNNQLKDLPEPFNDTYVTPCHTKKVFSNMARKSVNFSGNITPLFASMLVQNQAPEGEAPQTEAHQTAVSQIVFHEAHIEQILPSPTTYQRKRKTQKRRRTKKDTELPQTSVPLDHGADEAIHKEGGIIRVDGITSYHKSLSSMLRIFDRQDLVDLHRLEMKRFEDTTPEVHTLLMDGTLTSFNMLVEKRYPLIKEMLQKMLNWKLEAEAESTMAFELLKFIKSQLEE